jgi:hypothetical protein
MKKVWKMSLLLVVAVVLASCDKLGGGSDAGYQINAFAFQEEEGEPWGFMDFDGKVIVKPRFDEMPSCAVGDRFVVSDPEEGYILYSLEAKPRKIGSYDNVGSFTGKYCPVKDKKGNIKYIDKEGKDAFSMKEVSKKTVTAAFNYFCGRAMVRTEDGKWGYIDETGKPVIPIKYYDAWNFAEGLAIVYHDHDGDPDNKWSVIDTEGKEVFSKKFGEYKPSNFRFYGDYLVVADEDDRNIVLNRKGEVVKKMKEGIFVGAIYDGMFTTYDSDEEKFGLMNVNGEQVVKSKFESLNYNGKFLVGSTTDKKPFVLNKEGEKVTKLPEGYAVLFDPEYAGHANRMLVGNYEEGYVLCDAEGNAIKLGADIHDYSIGYNWGFMDSEEEEDYDDGDYEEEEYDEESEESEESEEGEE